MAAKTFKNDIAGTDRLFSANDTQDTKDTRNTERPAEKAVYRLNLKLSGELKEYLADAAWYNRVSITSLVNEILLDYMEKNPVNVKGNK